jgi:hypothetical protein
MKRNVLLALAAAVVCAAGQAWGQGVPSQRYAWKNVTITAGGFITGIVFHPKEEGLAYVRTDIGGAYRYEKGQGRWVPLLDWVGPQDGNLAGVESVAVDPNDADRVYLALGTYWRGAAGIARSKDRGKTFEVTRLPVSMGGNEDGRGMGERLAVDPGDGRVLFFGSRRDGLFRSADAGATWGPVDGFPIARAAASTAPGAAPRPAAGGGPGGAGAGGITWVHFMREGEPAGEPTRRLIAGVASGAEASVYQSVDGGTTWAAVPGAPKGPMPHRAAWEEATRTLYISYGNGPGPNGVTGGAVWKLDVRTGQWTDVTPPVLGNGGFGGIAVDPRHAGTLVVATIDRWSPGDDLYRSTDGGASWKGVAKTATRDPAGSPYLYWGQREPRFGWWMAAVALDPFDPGHVVYGTGATIWGTRDMRAFDRGEPTRWTVEAAGIEETAVLALASPPAGAPLISGLGDIGGFTHHDLAVSPPAGMHAGPIFTNTTGLDFAELKPAVVVRTGTPHQPGGGATAAVSADGGDTWKAVTVPGTALPGARGQVAGGGPVLAVSADGGVLMAAGNRVQVSRDLGVTWTECPRLPANSRPVADRAAPATFYVFDWSEGTVWTSTDGGATFDARRTEGLSFRGAARGAGTGGGLPRVQAAPGKVGDLWASASGKLYHSTDGGRQFAPVAAGVTVHQFTFGKAAPWRQEPTLFVAGRIGQGEGIYRSDDGGEVWVRINDDAHQFGGWPTVMAGDPRVYGRVYVGMNGRGIVYGDVAQ